MLKYRVFVLETIRRYADIEALSSEDAVDAAGGMDYDEFTDAQTGDWEIISATELPPEKPADA